MTMIMTRMKVGLEELASTCHQSWNAVGGFFAVMGLKATSGIFDLENLP